MVIYWEARSEPLRDQSAVAHVALNRTSHPDFPSDVCAVVKQGGETKRNSCQFSWWCNIRDKTPREEDAWEIAVEQAEAVLEGTSEDPTGGAVYFHNRSVRPKWAAVKERTATLGRHIFYR
jgi:N-acetylmuramoyl-L-alanine amidase